MVAGVRPELHRFCTRMSGSVLDGEDIVQEALIQAFYKLPSLRDVSRLRPWLFRIAHNKCIDLLRRRRGMDFASVDLEEVDFDHAQDPEARVRVGEAFAAIVTSLPPKERAAVVLKDVLDYPLSDIAEIVDSTVGGVKAALHRGRAKLEELRPDAGGNPLAPGERILVQAYLDRFNHHDWEGVLELIRSDARLELVDRTEANAHDIMKSRYCTNYENLPWTWKLEIAWIDGEEMIVHLKKTERGWQPHAAMRLVWADNHVVSVRDYIHVEYLLDDAVVHRDERPPT